MDESFRTDSLRFQLYRSEDDAALTDLLHRAYAGLLAQGLNFTATTQDVETTRRRIASGECWVCLSGDQIVGTICLILNGRPSHPLYYQRPEVAHFSQFGVDPDWRGKGIGKKLHSIVSERAKEEGKQIMALDTAQPAVDLIRLYEAWGYQEVGLHNWGPPINYTSVLMARWIGDGDASPENLRQMVP